MSGEDIAKKTDKVAKVADVAKATGPTTPTGAVATGASAVLHASEYVTDPKKRKKAFWVIFSCCTCCFAPFLMGLILGIVVITNLCQKYNDYKTWKPRVITGITAISPGLGLTLWSADKFTNFLTSDNAEKIYSRLPGNIQDSLPYSMIKLFAGSDEFFNEICGTTLNYSGGNMLPCGTFAEIIEKYVGKGADEMEKLMTGAGFMFHPGVWCADSVAFFVSQMGYPVSISDFWYPHTNNWIARFRSGKDGWRLLANGETPQPGDVAMAKDGHHTCMVYQVIDANHFYCFGGNQGGGRVTKDSYRTTSEWYFGRLPGR